MFKLYIRDRNNHDNLQELAFKNTKQIRNFIRNVSTKDIEKKEYVFLKSNDIEFFFYNTYKPEFFHVNNVGVSLLKMPNGIKREIRYERKSTFNNRTLNKALQRIKEELAWDKIVLNIGSFDKNRTHKITFTRTDNLGKAIDYALVSFDKLLWEHTIEHITSDNPKQFIRQIDNAISKHTSSTRRARKRKYENNSK